MAYTSASCIDIFYDHNISRARVSSLIVYFVFVFSKWRYRAVNPTILIEQSAMKVMTCVKQMMIQSSSRVVHFTLSTSPAEVWINNDRFQE